MKNIKTDCKWRTLAINTGRDAASVDDSNHCIIIILRIITIITKMILIEKMKMSENLFYKHAFLMISTHFFLFISLDVKK